MTKLLHRADSAWVRWAGPVSDETSDRLLRVGDVYKLSVLPFTITFAFTYRTSRHVSYIASHRISCVRHVRYRHCRRSVIAGEWSPASCGHRHSTRVAVAAPLLMGTPVTITSPTGRYIGGRFPTSREGFRKRPVGRRGTGCHPRSPVNPTGARSLIRPDSSTRSDPA